MKTDSSHIRYAINQPITPDQFIDLLRRSTLAECRPVGDRECITAMLNHANLLCTAWLGDTLVGVARSLTDFSYCCYLSDLAVDERHQRHGIGRELIRLTQSRLIGKARLILLSAPKAQAYYPKLGFDPHPSAWVLPCDKSIR